MVLQRRNEAPKSWLNKQRHLVNGESPLAPPQPAHVPFPLCLFAVFFSVVAVGEGVAAGWGGCEVVVHVLTICSYGKEVKIALSIQHL